MFILSKVPFGNFFLTIWLTISFAIAAAPWISDGDSDTSSENAIDGTPKIAPSIAAATVPEYNTLIPTLAPIFIPAINNSGFSFIISRTPSLTQSAGEPSIP